jgi:hypothetical protein
LTRPAPDIAKQLRHRATKRVYWIDARLDNEAADALEQMHEALKPYLNQHNYGDRNHHCVCSYCNRARAALGGDGMGDLWATRPDQGGTVGGGGQ